jgi:hypothetical protein
MSLIDLASLVLAPTATKEGKVYSAIPDTGEGDMTFTRGSSATRVNSAGLIEKERGNLLLQSNSFDTTWVNGNTSEVSGQTGYDGSNDAWLLSKTATSYSYIQQAITKSGVCTLSVYAKAGTLDWIWIRAIDGVDNPNVFFDLQNGVKGITGGTNYIDSSIEQVGATGWYRLKLVFSQGITEIRIYPADDDGDVSGTSGNILIQDAMLNEGLVAQPYIETTTTAVYEGITDDVPRVDYSGGGCPSLLLEPSRTNLLDNSEYLSGWNAYTPSSTITNNAAISPEGVQNACEITFTGSGNDVAYDNSFYTTTAPSVFSVYLRVASGTKLVALRTAIENEYKAVTITTEWQRFELDITLPQANERIGIDNRAAYGGSGTAGTIEVYGAMLEAGSYSTSYVPSYGTSTTRVADSCSKTGISELIGQTEGTFFAEFKYNGFNGPISQNALYTRAAGTTSNYLYINVYNGRINIGFRVNSTTLFDTLQGPNPLSEGVHKCAFAYKSGDIVIYLDGQNIYVPSNNVYSNLSLAELGIGNNTTGGNQLGDGINQALVFKTRLTNDELAILTK